MASRPSLRPWIDRVDDAHPSSHAGRILWILVLLAVLALLLSTAEARPSGWGQPANFLQTGDFQSRM